jgi:hypothetical protein
MSYRLNRPSFTLRLIAVTRGGLSEHCVFSGAKKTVVSFLELKARFVFSGEKKTVPLLQVRITRQKLKSAFSNQRG